MEDFKLTLANGEHFVVLEWSVLAFDVAFAGVLAEVVWRLEVVGQLVTAGDVVRVDVRVDHARNREIGFLGLQLREQVWRNCGNNTRLDCLE